MLSALCSRHLWQRYRDYHMHKRGNFTGSVKNFHILRNRNLPLKVLNQGPGHETCDDYVASEDCLAKRFALLCTAITWSVRTKASCWGSNPWILAPFRHPKPWMEQVRGRLWESVLGAEARRPNHGEAPEALHFNVLLLKLLRLQLVLQGCNSTTFFRSTLPSTFILHGPCLLLLTQHLRICSSSR